MKWGLWVAKSQWDAACRAFLFRHPWIGIANANIALGGNEGLVKGWNRISYSPGSRSPFYIFIGEKHGKTVSALPLGVEGPVNDVVRRTPSLHASHLWAALRGSGENLIAHGGGPPAAVYRVRHYVQQATLENKDEKVVPDLSLQGVKLIRDAWRRSFSEPMGLDEFECPIRAHVNAFMDFDIHGVIASGVVGSLLFTLCSIEELRRAGAGPEVDPFVDSVEHLAGMMNRLLIRREEMNTASYMQASYLAGLYGIAALELISLARDAIKSAYSAEVFGKWTDTSFDRLGRLALNIDELNAHRIAPTFMLPALFTPLELMRRIRRMNASRDSLVTDWAAFYQLDPAFRKMAAMATDWQVETHRECAEMHRDHSEALMEFDVRAAIGGDTSPFSPWLRRNLTMCLLANQAKWLGHTGG